MATTSVRPENDVESNCEYKSNAIVNINISSSPSSSERISGSTAAISKEFLDRLQLFRFQYPQNIHNMRQHIKHLR